MEEKKNIDKQVVFGNKAGNKYRHPGLDAPKTEEKIQARTAVKRLEEMDNKIQKTKVKD
jgi:hypothetical protein